MLWCCDFWRWQFQGSFRGRWAAKELWGFVDAILVISARPACAAEKFPIARNSSAFLYLEEDVLSKPVLTLGVKVREINEQLSKKYDLPEGIYVVEVVSFSPAEKAGIKSGDVVRE